MVEIIAKYENIKDLEHLIIQNEGIIIQKEYTEKVKLLIEISEEKIEKILKNNFQNITIKIKEKRKIKQKHK